MYLRKTVFLQEDFNSLYSLRYIGDNGNRKF